MGSKPTDPRAALGARWVRGIPTAGLFNVFIRVCGAGAFVLGLAFWCGYARSLTWLHMGLGIGLVVSLWVTAGIAWRNAAPTALVAFAAVWGLVTWVFGMTQSRILPGSVHWAVEFAHLAAGIVAVFVGTRLAVAVADRRISS